MATPSGKRTARPLDFDLRSAIIAGGAAGAHTVTGIKPGDILVAVHHHQTAALPADLTSEFAISAADTIDNTAGTATTGGALKVWWKALAP